MSMRSSVVDQLKGELPSSWVIVDDERALNVISKPTVIVSMRSLAPSDFAPLHNITVTIALLLLSPHTDASKAEDQLDDLIVTTLAAFQNLSGLTWTDATKIVHMDRYMGYEITTEATATLGD